MGLMQGTVEYHSAGSHYSVQPRVFHETFCNEPTITLVQKSRYEKHTPRVLCPLGWAPDNDFTRYDEDPDRLWSILEAVMR